MNPVGRNSEIDQLRALLQRAGGAVILGPPGIGKSAVAAAFTPSVWVDLELIRTADGLQRALSAALATPVDNRGAVLEALRSVPLLVLDGAEGVGEALASWSLDALPTPVLITSRRRPSLDLPVLELGPLSPEDGADLLLRRVGSATLAAALDRGSLREIAAALDGVPLALELAARALRLHPPEVVLARTLAQLADTTRPARQQLLDQVRAGWAQLSDGARRVLSMASGLPGSFDTALLERLCGESIDAAVIELLDAAQLHSVGEVPPRFRVLGPIREVAAAHLDPAAWQDGLRRMAEGVLGPSEAAVLDLEGPLVEPSPRTLQGLAPLLEQLGRSEEPSIRLRAAIALAAMRRRTGPLAETLAHDRRLLDEGPDGLRLQWALDVAEAACHLGEFDRAEAALDRAEALGEGALVRSARALWLAGVGRLDEALSLAESVAKTGEPLFAFRLGAIRFQVGEFADAIPDFQRARETQSAFRRAQATYALCVSMREAGRAPAEILWELSRVEDVADLRAYTWLVPRFAGVRGVLQADAGELAEGRRALLQAADQLRALGETDDALRLWLTAQSLDFALGEVPRVVLDSVVGSMGAEAAAVRDGWRAVVQAALGNPTAALGLGLPAIEVLAERQHAQQLELSCLLAVALSATRQPQAAALLADLDGADPLVQLARAALAGRPVEPGPRLEQRVLAGIARGHSQAVRVALDGSAFALDATGERVDIARRRVLRQVLAALARADGPLDVHALCGQVWPGESLVGESGTRRVHVAISTLRGLGLRQAITTVTAADGSTGWLLVAGRAAVL